MHCFQHVVIIAPVTSSIGLPVIVYVRDFANTLIEQWLGILWGSITVVDDVRIKQISCGVSGTVDRSEMKPSMQHDGEGKEVTRMRSRMEFFIYIF
jgi:hypothetical protein